jgi:3-hydroxy-3-methylglutaryl CoA synthase
VFNKAYIPYGGYFSTPFCKWQGSLQNENSIKLAAQTGKRFLKAKGFDPQMIEFLYLGHTVIQPGSFFGASWAANEMGLTIPGMAISHACATSTNTIYSAALAVEMGTLSTAYCMMTDRISMRHILSGQIHKVRAGKSCRKISTWTISTVILQLALGC